MDIIEAVNQRKSIRAFKSNPVPQDVLREIVGMALRAPSWSNTQPWGFAIVGGKKLEEIKEALEKNLEERPNPDLPYPREYPESYTSRSRALGIKIFETKGIGREDKEKRRWWQLQGLRLFGAPSVIYIYIDHSIYVQGDKLNVWPMLDCGLVAENIMLLAVNYGLGTIPQARTISYPDVLREILGIPESKVMVLGIAIGYPDWDDTVNQFRSERESLENVASWYGFD